MQSGNAIDLAEAKSLMQNQTAMLRAYRYARHFLRRVIKYFIKCIAIITGS